MHTWLYTLLQRAALRMQPDLIKSDIQQVIIGEFIHICSWQRQLNSKSDNRRIISELHKTQAVRVDINEKFKVKDFCLILIKVSLKEEYNG